MIRPSRFRRLLTGGLVRRGATLVVGSLALVAAGVGGAGCSQTCSAIGCLSGLTVGFDGRFDPAATYFIDISQVTARPEVVPMASCTRSGGGDAGVVHLQCSSTYEHVEEWNGVRFPAETRIQKLVVKVSRGEGATRVELGEQTLVPAFTSSEISGPGCGVCTRAKVSVTIP